MIDASMFDFDAMKEAVGADPFAEATNKQGRDDRFYKLTKDKDGNGAALIRFLPDSEKGMIKQLYKINTTITKNGKKRFVNEFSPQTIGAPCPFQEKWQELWNAGDKEGAKLYGRGIVYVANIKVINDPKNPENNGKIFLYEMSGKLKTKIQDAMSPSDSDIALGAVPKQVFNPFKGNSFRLVAKKGANGQINYDASEVVNEVTSIYNSIEEGLEDLNNNTYKLSDLVKPESFMSYAELKSKFDWVTFADTTPVAQNVQSVQPLTAEAAPVQTTVPEVNTGTAQAVAQPVLQEQVDQTKPKEQSLDAMLDGLL